MGVYSGPDLKEDGLVLYLDAGNKKTFANSVINSTSWDLGSGSASGYGQNGNTNENERVTGTDPFGKSATVWETRASGDGGADGGWNSDWYNIDNTKLYRFSVWVKRTSTSSGGTFYLGLYANATGVRRTDTSAYEGNPYWECSGTSKFDKDVWYLVVGHCYPYNTSYTGQHPETGIYTVAGGATKVLSINACNIGTDVKWSSDVTQTIHRCYHYYCADNTTRLQLFDPRIDAIDGTEPSISALLSGFTANRLSDLVGSNNGTFKNAPTYSSANGGSIVFDGTNDYISIPFETILNDCSIEVWFKATSTRSYQYLLSIGNEVNSSYSFYLDMNDPDGSGFAQTMWVYWNSGGTPYSVIPKTGTYGDWNDSTWRHYVFTRSSTTNHYMNGSLVTNVSRSGDQTTQFGNGSGYKLKIGVYQITNTNAFPGNIAQVKIYNRALTASEVQQNFNATRSRFGI